MITHRLTKPAPIITLGMLVHCPCKKACFMRPLFLGNHIKLIPHHKFHAGNLLTLPYLESKINVPFCSQNLVSRSRLIQSLNRIFQPGIQVGLVLAPAGFGKTSLLAEWIKNIPGDPACTSRPCDEVTFSGCKLV